MCLTEKERSLSWNKQSDLVVSSKWKREKGVTVRDAIQEDKMRSLEEKRLTGPASGRPLFPDRRKTYTV
jgi:hypothetical protein